MEFPAISAALKDRLGPEATDGLLQLIGHVETHLREDVITACTERFERRLVEETSTLRVQIAQVESSIRQDMTRLGSDLRQEIGALGSALRQEMGALGSELRQDMTRLGGELRQEMSALRGELQQEMGGLRGDLRLEIGAQGNDLRQEMAALRRRMDAGRFELLKWAFLFWIGQVVAIGTLIGVMLRMTGR